MPGKSLSGSVGRGGLNRAADVMTVQFLLNCVPVSQGGPVKDLAVDGIVGPKTIQAINQFQERQFGWADGRVDPEHNGGTTIVALKKFDPVPDSVIEPTPAPKYPSQPEGKGASSGKSGWSGGKLGGSGGQSGGKLGSGGAGGKFGGQSGPGVKSF
jgi:peptidoglycan hydrolase-like protein with peptidoglycan-binding domain